MVEWTYIICSVEMWKFNKKIGSLVHCERKIFFSCIYNKKIYSSDVPVFNFIMSNVYFQVNNLCWPKIWVVNYGGYAVPYTLPKKIIFLI